MKKILFITTRQFWPVDSGRKLTLYHYCRGLHDVYGYEMYIYSFLEGGQTSESSEEKPYFIQDVQYAKKIKFSEKIKNVFCRSCFSKDHLPLQCSLYYSRENVEAINNAVTELDPDAIIVDMVRLAPYYKAFEHYKCKKILDMDDVLSLRYERQVQNKVSEANFLGNYGKEFSSSLNRILNLKIFKNAFLKFESKLMKKAEKKYTHLYDSVILVSDKEAEYINKITNTSKAIAITVGVDYKYLSEDIGVTSADNTVSFMGNLNVAANADSLDIIIRKILPIIKSKVTLIVIGSCPEEITEKYKDVKNVKFTGRVDDFRPYIRSSKVFLSPIAYGSGIKTKILEAMAMGIPVITNSIGAEGILAKNGKHWIVCDEPKKIATSVDELLYSQERCDEIGQNAKKLVEKNFQWNIIFEQFKKLGLYGI